MNQGCYNVLQIVFWDTLYVYLFRPKYPLFNSINIPYKLVSVSSFQLNIQFNVVYFSLLIFKNYIQ